MWFTRIFHETSYSSSNTNLYFSWFLFVNLAHDFADTLHQTREYTPKLNFSNTSCYWLLLSLLNVIAWQFSSHVNHNCQSFTHLLVFNCRCFFLLKMVHFYITVTQTMKNINFTAKSLIRDLLIDIQSTMHSNKR